MAAYKSNRLLMIIVALFGVAGVIVGISQS